LGDGLTLAEAARGTLYIAVQNVLQYFVLFLFYVVVTRVLSPSDVGKISTLLFFMTIFTVFTQFSLPVASAKFISESIGKGQAAVAGAAAEKAFRLVLLFSVPSMMLASFLSPWISTILLGTDAEAISFTVIAATSVVLNIAALYGGYLRGLGKFREMALAGSTFIVFSRVIGVTLAWLGYGVLGVALGWFLGAVVSLFLSRFFLGGELSHSREDEFSVKTLLVYCYSASTYTIITTMQSWIDVMILYVLTSDLALEGIYYLAVTGSAIISIVWKAITTTVLPLISAKYGKDRKVSREISVSTRLLNLAVLPLSLSLAAASQTAIVIAYGPTYLAGVLPFTVLTLTSIVQAYEDLFVTVLLAIGETGALMNIGLVTSVLDAIVIVVLGRWLGVMAAVVARVVMFSMAMILCHWEVKKRVRFTIDGDSFKRALLLSTVVAAPIAFADSVLTHAIRIHPLMTLLVDGAIFLSVGLLVAKRFKVFRARDIELLTQALPESLHGLLGLIERLVL